MWYEIFFWKFNAAITMNLDVTKYNPVVNHLCQYLLVFPVNATGMAYAYLSAFCQPCTYYVRTLVVTIVKFDVGHCNMNYF